MGIDIALVTVAIVTITFAALRVMKGQRPSAEPEPEPAPAPVLPKRRAPVHFALPPVTIETLPMKLEYVPDMVPPIDRSVLAALVASGSRTGSTVSRPTTHSDLDSAETLRQASDLDDDALTRTHMSPVS